MENLHPQDLALDCESVRRVNTPYSLNNNCYKQFCLLFIAYSLNNTRSHNYKFTKQAQRVYVSLKLISSEMFRRLFVRKCVITRVCTLFSCRLSWCSPTLFPKSEFPRLKFTRRFRIVGTYDLRERKREKQSSIGITTHFFYLLQHSCFKLCIDK